MIQINQEKNWLIQQANKNPASIAVISANSKLTYKELYEQSLSTSSQFDNYSIRPDDHIAVISKNSLEFVLVICASWLRGCIPVVINERLTGGNIKEIINNSDARLVISGNNSFDSEIDIKCISINELFESPPSNNNPEIKTNGEAVLIYTSGTSGNPKGVPITFSSLLKSVSAVDAIDKYSEHDKFLLSLPLYHIGGFSILARSILAGATLVIPDEFNLSNVGSKLIEYEPSIVSIVPTMLKVLIDKTAVLPDSVRLIYVGGGPGNPAVINKAIDLRYPVVKVYGSTETCAMITYADSELLQNYPDSSGKTIGNTKIEILNEDGEVLEPEKTGEIVIQSESLFEGYYKNDIETERKIVNGKYYSGDLGYLDAIGNLFVESRRADLIVTGGENVYPAEIVGELNKHHAVLDSVVFGIEDDHWGQIICAAIVSDESEGGSVEQITQFLKNELPAFKIPKQYFFVDSLPYNELGKVNISALKISLNLNV